MDGQPLLGNNFRVLIDGVEVGISEISSLTSEAEGGYRTVVLRRALTGSRELFSWREQAQAGEPAERRVLIEHQDSTGTPVIGAFELEGAWPCRWSGPALNASDGESIAYEELELAYSRLHWHDSERPEGAATR
jgi:hypothetical protein